MSVDQRNDAAGQDEIIPEPNESNSIDEKILTAASTKASKIYPDKKKEEANHCYFKCVCRCIGGISYFARDGFLRPQDA